MYSVTEFGVMIADQVRMRAYARALRERIRPGSVVLDIGTGTGIFALLACRFGARRVYAVEPGDAIEVARDVAAANGFADRIRFIRERVEDVKLPERVDVIVSDLRGALPFSGPHLRVIADARERLLAPGGALLPLRDEVFAAPVEAPELYRRNTAIWTENPWELDMRAARGLVVNTIWSAPGDEVTLLAEAAGVATVDYRTITDPSFSTRTGWRVARAGTLHALVLWFDATIAEGISFSTAPGRPDLVYGRVCLPLEMPVEVREGERIEVSLRADLVGGDYVTSWETRILPAERETAARARFRQSTFFGGPLAPSRLRAFDPDHQPGLGARGRVDRLVLDLMGTGLANEVIARRVSESFPERYPSWRNALSRVGTLAASYGAR